MFVFVLLCIVLFPLKNSIILKRKRDLIALLLLSYGCYCKCSVTLPRCAVCWSAMRAGVIF